MTRAAFVTGASGFVGGALVRRLIAEGWSVRALARSDGAAATVAALGAQPVRGRLADLPDLASSIEGCSVAFHCAAHVALFDRREIFEQVNVEGTRAVVDSCARAGVRRLVHVSSEAAVWAGEPLVGIDEDAPLRPDSTVPYCASKARAEQAAMEGHGRDALTVSIVRPRMIWGHGDTTLLPSLVESMRKGKFAWIGGGRHRTDTTHVDNAVEALVLAGRSERSGRAWFVTDGQPLEFRAFVTGLVDTQDVKPPSRSIPRPLALGAARAAETTWRILRRHAAPPITTFEVWVSSLEVTIDISRARADLGYEPIVSRPVGLAGLTAAPDREGTSG